MITARVVDQKYFPEVNSLTLGQYHFVLKRALEGEYALGEYAYFIDELCEGSKTIIGRTFLRDLETVTKKYRNTIVHQSSLNNKEYDHLRGLIFSGDEALLKTCCGGLP